MCSSPARTGRRRWACSRSCLSSSRRTARRIRCSRTRSWTSPHRRRRQTRRSSRTGTHSGCSTASGAARRQDRTRRFPKIRHGPHSYFRSSSGLSLAFSTSSRTLRRATRLSTNRAILNRAILKRTVCTAGLGRSRSKSRVAKRQVSRRLKGLQQRLRRARRSSTMPQRSGKGSSTGSASATREKMRSAPWT